MWMFSPRRNLNRSPGRENCVVCCLVIRCKYHQAREVSFYPSTHMTTGFVVLD